jgi:hypothetical protein
MIKTVFADTLYMLMEQKKLHSLTVGTEVYGKNNNNEHVPLKYSYTPKRVEYILLTMCAEKCLMITTDRPISNVLIDGNYRLTASLVPRPSFTLKREIREHDQH